MTIWADTPSWPLLSSQSTTCYLSFLRTFFFDCKYYTPSHRFISLLCLSNITCSDILVVFLFLFHCWISFSLSAVTDEGELPPFNFYIVIIISFYSVKQRLNLSALWPFILHISTPYILDKSKHNWEQTY